jgi:hypothetical protein
MFSKDEGMKFVKIWLSTIPAWSISDDLKNIQQKLTNWKVRNTVKGLTILFFSVVLTKIREKNLSTIRPRPCKPPQIMNRISAPCQRPR